MSWNKCACKHCGVPNWMPATIKYGKTLIPDVCPICNDRTYGLLHVGEYVICLKGKTGSHWTTKYNGWQTAEDVINQIDWWFDYRVGSDSIIGLGSWVSCG